MADAVDASDASDAVFRRTPLYLWWILYRQDCLLRVYEFGPLK